MKKMMIAACAALIGFSASAGCTWSWWRDHAGTDNKGCALGLACENKTISGAQVSVCISDADKVTSGCQYAIGYSHARQLRNGVQLAFFNNAQHAALQIGLICRNEGGFLPWFVFFNFDKTQYGREK